jgi:hypothetical protein
MTGETWTVLEYMTKKIKLSRTCYEGTEGGGGGRGTIPVSTSALDWGEWFKSPPRKNPGTHWSWMYDSCEKNSAIWLHDSHSWRVQRPVVTVSITDFKEHKLHIFHTYYTHTHTHISLHSWRNAPQIIANVMECTLVYNTQSHFSKTMGFDV